MCHLIPIFVIVSHRQDVKKFFMVAVLKKVKKATVGKELQVAATHIQTISMLTREHGEFIM